MKTTTNNTTTTRTDNLVKVAQTQIDKTIETLVQAREEAEKAIKQYIENGTDKYELDRLINRRDAVQTMILTLGEANSVYNG